MGVLLGLIIIGALVYTVHVTINSILAYGDGKRDALRNPPYDQYNNDDMMPAAYFYNLGYIRHEYNSDRKTLKQKNRERFGRE